MFLSLASVHNHLEFGLFLNKEVIRMPSTNPEVLCNVVECKYNESAKVCNAGKIQVTKHHAEVRTTEATDCGTFELGNGREKV